MHQPPTRMDRSVTSVIGDYTLMRAPSPLMPSLVGTVVPIAIGLIAMGGALIGPVHWGKTAPPPGTPGDPLAALFAFLIGASFLSFGLRTLYRMIRGDSVRGSSLALGTLGFQLGRSAPVMWAEVRAIEVEAFALRVALPGPIVVQTGPSSLAPESAVRRIFIDPGSVGSDSMSLLAVMQGCLERFVQSQGGSAGGMHVVRLTPDPSGERVSILSPPD